jgi:hypothetical protein
MLSAQEIFKRLSPNRFQMIVEDPSEMLYPWRSASDLTFDTSELSIKGESHEIFDI